MKGKKVLFIISGLDCGGINRALENLLRIWKPECKVDILAFDNTGQYKRGFENSSLINAPLWLNYQIRHLKYQKGIDKSICAFVKICNRLTRNLFYKKAKERFQKRLSNYGYDTVIAFSEGLPTAFASGIKVPNKIAWIHCDYQSYLSFCPGNRENEKQSYDMYDHIVCVSNFTRESFSKIFPEFRNKSEYIYNVLDIGSMKDKAQEFDVEEFQKGKFNIVTVGRIDPVKCPSRIPAIAAGIKGVNYNWYIIGPVIWQSEYELLMAEIKRFGLEDKVHLLGPKENPYPYIQQADLLVSTSVSEACPYVINEAKVLGTPVVCCDFGSAKEFITEGKDGFYVPVEKVSEVINTLCNDRHLYDSIKNNIGSFEYDNSAIVNKIIKLL